MKNLKENEFIKEMPGLVSLLTGAGKNSQLTTATGLETKNFFTCLSISLLYPDFYEISGSFTRKAVPAQKIVQNLSPDIFQSFPFPEGLTIPLKVISRFKFHFERLEETLPGLVHEYFLEKEAGSCESSRKSKGVYYTPSFIADYIVENSLGALLENKLIKFKDATRRGDTYDFVSTWNHLENLKILDPASGWGIFLLYTYHNLKKFYGRVEKLARSLLNRYARGNFDLNDMFCRDYVDLVEDHQLLLDVISACKNPSHRILGHLRGFELCKDSANLCFHILKGLCASSGDPIKDDFKAGIENVDFINWMENPSEKFDVIIGNPPYFTIGGGGRSRKKSAYHDAIEQHPFFGEYFRSQSDIFYYFIIGGINLLKPGGIISYIVPSYWLDNEFADALRSEIVQKCEVEELVNFESCPVFKTAVGRELSVDTMIFRAKRKTNRQSSRGSSFWVYRAGKSGEETTDASSFVRKIRNCPEKTIREKVKHANLTAGKWMLSSENDILFRLVKDGENILPLGDITPKQRAKYPREFTGNLEGRIEGICQIGQGQETGFSSVFVISRQQAEVLKLEKQLLKPNVKNQNIKRWIIEPGDKFVVMTRNEDQIEKYPNIRKYLESHRKALEKRQRVLTGKRKWYAVSIPQNWQIFNTCPKILAPYRAPENRFALDKVGYFNDGGDVRGLILKDSWKEKMSLEYILALLNSTLIRFWYQRAGKRKGKLLEFFTRPLSRIPVKIPPPEDHHRVVQLVKKIIQLYSSGSGKPADQEVKSIENRIDEIIFRIYNVDPDEIR